MADPLATKAETRTIGSHAPAPVHFIGVGSTAAQDAANAPARTHADDEADLQAKIHATPSIQIIRGNAASLPPPTGATTIYTVTPQDAAARYKSNVQATPQEKLRRRAEDAQIRAQHQLDVFQGTDVRGTVPK